MIPTHGFTRQGHPIHGRTIDHHPDETAYQRFNKRAALIITRNVGTMSCTWAFFVLALCSLPATLVLAHVVQGSVFIIAGLYVASAGLILLVTWVAQSFLQLVLLPALMVGQNLQTVAADARASRTFADVETIIDRLDLHTTGGLKDLHDALVTRIDARIDALKWDRVPPANQADAQP